MIFTKTYQLYDYIADPNEQTRIVFETSALVSV